MNWFIVAPHYRHNCAGIRVMHRLCHKLNEIGETAHISTGITNPKWNTPYQEWPNPNDIVVYPEIIYGNPYKASRVVRYVLFYPGQNGGDLKYDWSEMIVYYTKSYRISSGPIICISSVDESAFYAGDKTNDIVFVGKGNKTTAPWPENAIEITGKWPTTRDETIALIRSAKRIYSYDICTSLINEGLLAQAKVYLPGYNKWILYDKPAPLPPWNDLTETQRLINMVKEYFNAY